MLCIQIDWAHLQGASWRNLRQKITKPINISSKPSHLVRPRAYSELPPNLAPSHPPSRSPDNDLFSILTTDRRYSANCCLSPKALNVAQFRESEVTASRDYGATSLGSVKPRPKSLDCG